MVGATRIKSGIHTRKSGICPTLPTSQKRYTQCVAATTRARTHSSQAPLARHKIEPDAQIHALGPCLLCPCRTSRPTSAIDVCFPPPAHRATSLSPPAPRTAQEPHRQCSTFPGMVPPRESSGRALKSKSCMDTRYCKYTWALEEGPAVWYFIPIPCTAPAWARIPTSLPPPRSFGVHPRTSTARTARMRSKIVDTFIYAWG